jgi:hypothetical protein
VLGASGFRKQTLVRDDCEIERRGIVFGAGEAGGVVGERGARQLILRKAARDLAPALDARAEVRFGERPQVPGTAIPLVRLLRARRERADHLGATSGEPVRIREDHHRLCVVGAPGNDGLVRWDDDLGHVGIRARGMPELFGIAPCREGAHAIDERTDVGGHPILFHDLREIEIWRGSTRFHAEILLAECRGVSPSALMTPETESFVLLLVVEDDSRAEALPPRLSMVLPRASTVTANVAMLAEEKLPRADATLVDGGASAKATVDTLRTLRARGFEAPILVVTPVPDDVALRAAMNSLGARAVSRELVDRSPAELAVAITAALDSAPGVTAELRQARRIFAAGQAALSLQHAINNPLAALLAEAQLLQLEELSAEQRGSVDRMVELCRRVVALVRRLDALTES